MNSKIMIGVVMALLSAPLTWAETETREVDEFDAVNFALPFSVEFVVSDEPFVTLEGDEDTIEEITTKVRGGTLKITKDSDWFDWSDEEVHVTIGYQNLSSITLAGSGDGYAKNMEADKLTLRITGSAGLELDNLTCNDLEISIAGSGNVNINDLEADSISTRIAGSGDVEVTGRVVSQKISIAGSGDLNARELRAQETEVNIKGSGDVEVWTIASLDANVMGSGDIEYYGDPKVRERILGSGNLERRGDRP